MSLRLSVKHCLEMRKENLTSKICEFNIFNIRRFLQIIVDLLTKKFDRVELIALFGCNKKICLLYLSFNPIIPSSLLNLTKTTSY